MVAVDAVLGLFGAGVLVIVSWLVVKESSEEVSVLLCPVQETNTLVNRIKLIRSFIRSIFKDGAAAFF